MSATHAGLARLADVERKPCSGNNTDAAGTARVAVVLFSLFRAPSLTLDSVRRHVISPLQQACATVDVYLHTYGNPTRLSNPRSGEKNVTLHLPWELVRDALQPRAFALTDQREDMRQLRDGVLNGSVALSHAAAIGDDEGASAAELTLRNTLAQWNSLERASRLWADDQATARFASVLCIRADVDVLPPLDVPAVLAPRRNTLYTPFWHSWEGLNDRVAFGRPDVMLSYSRRFGTLLEYMRSDSSVIF